MRASGHEKSRNGALGIVFAWLLLTEGCVGPLGPKDEDLGLRLDPARLNSAAPLDLSRRAGPAPAESESLRREKPADPFAGASTVDVGLGQARAWTLQHNLNLNVEMLAPRIAKENLTAEEAKDYGIIDTVLEYRKLSAKK